MDRFIIEHPTRGTLKFLVSEEEYGFSTSGSRNDPDKTQQMHSLVEAYHVLGKLPEKLRAACKVMFLDPKKLEYVDTATWTTETLQQEYEVLGFSMGYCVVRRKSDGQRGSLEFTHSPRVYFGFVAG